MEVVIEFNFLKMFILKSSNNPGKWTNKLWTQGNIMQL